MKTEITLCNHLCKRGTLLAEKYAIPAIFLMWLLTTGLIYSMTL